MKRFISMDPLGYVDSMNMYESFGCDPVNNVDPMGLRTEVTLIRYSPYIPNNMSNIGPITEGEIVYDVKICIVRAISNQEAWEKAKNAFITQVQRAFNEMSKYSFILTETDQNGRDIERNVAVRFNLTYKTLENKQAIKNLTKENIRRSGYHHIFLTSSNSKMPSNFRLQITGGMSAQQRRDIQARIENSRLNRPDLNWYRNPNQLPQAPNTGISYYGVLLYEFETGIGTVLKSTVHEIGHLLGLGEGFEIPINGTKKLQKNEWNMSQYGDDPHIYEYQDRFRRKHDVMFRTSSFAQPSPKRFLKYHLDTIARKTVGYTLRLHDDTPFYVNSYYGSKYGYKEDYQ